MTIEQLEKELNQNKLNSIYLLYGEDTFLLENSLKKIKKNFGELILGINYIIIDETNIEEIIPNIESPAFGYEKKLIIIKNSLLFKKEGKGKAKNLSNLKDNLHEYINNNLEIINETTTIVFVEQEIDRTLKLTKLLEKVGTVCNFEKQKPEQIVKRLKGICNAYKVNVNEKELKYLIELCGTNMQILINEIRKLIEYAGENGEITKEAIDLLSIKQIDAIIFDLTDNLGNKKISEAIIVLKNLIYSKEPEQKILITLYNHFKKLYIIKMAIKYNKDIAISLNLKPNQMFLITKYKKQAEYFNEKDLRIIIKELTNLDENYKKGLIDLNLGLEAILCQYCS